MKKMEHKINSTTVTNALHARTIAHDVINKEIKRAATAIYRAAKKGQFHCTEEYGSDVPHVQKALLANGFAFKVAPREDWPRRWVIDISWGDVDDKEVDETPLLRVVK